MPTWNPRPATKEREEKKSAMVSNDKETTALPASGHAANTSFMLSIAFYLNLIVLLWF
jgi:hypothetical protein